MGSASQGHEGNEKGRHEASCHEGSSASIASQGHEGNEKGRHEASCHEGSSSSQGHEGYEKGCHEASCHEGSSSSQGHESHEVNSNLRLLLRVWVCPCLLSVVGIGCVQEHG